MSRNCLLSGRSHALSPPTAVLVQSQQKVAAAATRHGWTRHRSSAAIRSRDSTGM
jgi:hypothetical protein